MSKCTGASDTRPLTKNEEQRLSTLSNFITMALFKPMDNFKYVVKINKEREGRLHVPLFWRGWPKQILGKAIDDEIFMSNIMRVNSIVEDSLNIEDPSKSPVGKAAVGVAARVLTLGVMVPYNNLQNARLDKASKSRLYAGFQRTALKESVFTASYVLSNAYFGNILSKYKPKIQAQLCKVVPSCDKDEKKAECYTNAVLASAKSAASGVFASVVATPIDLAGKNIPPMAQAETIARKSVRKGLYNGVNALVLQSLHTSKIHRRMLESVLPPPSSGAA